MVFCNIDETLNHCVEMSHNPYFNRWFSAIIYKQEIIKKEDKVTILILIDGFLQYKLFICVELPTYKVTILILIDGFLQYVNTFVYTNQKLVTILILIDGFLQ